MATTQNPDSPSTPALVPLLVVGVVLVPLLIGRVGTALSIALAVVELALVAAGGAMVARTVAARAAQGPEEGPQPVTAGSAAEAHR